MQSMINEIRSKMETVTALDPCGKFYQQTCALLDRLDAKGLKQVHEANIKFVSALAFNRMIRRGMTHEGAGL